MNQKTAAQYQRVEDHLTEALARCNEAMAGLAEMECASVETGASDPARLSAIVRLLQARRQLRKAGNALADRLFDASSVLAPEAADAGLDF
jgi:hypothetical protein